MIRSTSTQNIVYSIFRKKPKRADTYWFVHVDITSEPYGASYYVETIIPKNAFHSSEIWLSK
ncbi:MAG: hypothetical protein IPP60_13410 [Sphingobacteriales bacterium]|nr:hypothetical protein [Sphingobacteriales bacterium]